MKDLSLSPLSRGCGRVIAASAGDHGRLDVCFTPQDYYIWKSYDALLRMTNSGSLLRSEDSTIPKTYSTRRGPLLLYSRGLVTLGTESGSQASDIKRQVPRQHTQDVDHRPDALILRQNAQVRRRRRESSIIDEIPHNQHLPPTEDYHVTMGQASGTWTQQEVQTEPEWSEYARNDLNVPPHKQLEDGLEKEEVATEQETCDALDIKSPRSFANKTKADTSVEEDTERLSSDDKHNPDSSVQSVSFQRSPLVSLGTNVRSSPGSSCEGLSADRRVLTSSQGQLSSSCSTVMVTEEQLMLNLVKTEASRRNEEEKACRQAERADIQRQELERRREQEEEERMQLQEERKRTKDNMRTELEEERRRRVEHLRLRKLAEEEVRRRREEEEQERAGREQAERERLRRRQEERRRHMERLQKMREEEEGRRKAEVERLHLEEQRREEEECKRLQEMDASERDKYLAMKEREEEDRRTIEEEHRMREEEQALRAGEETRVEAELLARHMTPLQQKTAFKRGLLLEAEGMEQSQGISRPWVYSYFTLLQLPDLKPTKTYESITP
ncbi:uncharacterized protein KIAA2012 homolog [Phycodurus eques]|uniref:uncharacterized protein KIAA2012 homolog n=1 Tax=Phycodurus eques TaxID=693459 RepID=UPI002ACEB529|nr:uncharacterized protein KIAA2012 homolog [Phycodurus eques]